MLRVNVVIFGNFMSFPKRVTCFGVCVEGVFPTHNRLLQRYVDCPAQCSLCLMVMKMKRVHFSTAQRLEAAGMLQALHLS
jgi:hypothetical protein